jgi:hypothetical protein
MTHAFRRALDEPGLLAELVERGVARAQLYSWQRSARLLMAAVERMA